MSKGVSEAGRQRAARIGIAEPSKEELMGRIAELEKQVGSKKQGSLEFKVGEKGGQLRPRAYQAIPQAVQ